ncbi:hypothetical protein Golomagni_06334 [Golovinomyces magnicellulatus]|nr:hypothetical protein Golomagni_06334 [Golovinomyces magnicellulatus]
MAASESSRAGAAAAPMLGPSFSGSGTATKAKCTQVETKNTELGWGVVHFYRDEEESRGLRVPDQSQDADEDTTTPDCTTLCIPAVPAYMSPGDFMGFLGERWHNAISHCRLVMTSKMNRYLVLLKFRDNKSAKEWKRQFDGKVSSPDEACFVCYKRIAWVFWPLTNALLQPQVCHVVYVKSITFETSRVPSVNDYFSAGSSSAVSNSKKPFPPPTPNLVELPTCPVCLERMDETNGLMTIPCSHVFHCTCLQNWKGAGCPVCRFANASQGSSSDPSNPYAQPFGSHVSNLCSVCDCADDLWICLICGYVGCGRYKGGHAKDHWKETAHSFALELETQYVWDYAGDMWVHRLIRDKGDGKVVELPGRNENRGHQEDEDVVPRAKLENIGLEYTHLITSQLESQRAYYEEILSKAVDKASKASAAAENTAGQASTALKKFSTLESQFQTLSVDIVPQLERDLDREKNKATRSETLARSLGKSLQEEKKLNEGLMKRIEHLDVDNDAVRKQMLEMQQEIAELKEMNRDLSMFISGQEKLKEMEQEGKLEEGEVEGGSASVPEKKTRRKKK